MHLVAERQSKQIAGDLGTAVQTIKVHQRRVTAQLGVRTLVELTRLIERLPQRKD